MAEGALNDLAADVAAKVADFRTKLGDGTTGHDEFAAILNDAAVELGAIGLTEAEAAAARVEADAAAAEEANLRAEADAAAAAASAAAADPGYQNPQA